MFTMSIAAIIAVIKSVLFTNDLKYFALDEADSLKRFQKFCRKQIFEEIDFADVFNAVGNALHGSVIGITSAEIYSRRARYDMPDDYFFEGSGQIDISFNAYIEGYECGENRIYCVTFSLFDVMQRESSEDIFNVGKNSGIIKRYYEP